MVQTGQFVHDYLGNPDMNMAAIAAASASTARWWTAAGAIARGAGARARRTRSRASPTCIDVQVARKGVAWADKPWVPPIQVAAMRQKKV